MAKHNELGKAGENAAVTYLEQQGYIIRDRNWRKGHFELDIVATKEQELIVVEVKTRSNTQFAETPQDRVNRQFVAERPDSLWVADFTYGVPGVQGGHGCLNEPRVCLEY